MCYLCTKADDFSIGHLEMEIKKLSKNQQTAQIQKTKKQIEQYTLMLKSHHSCGYEKFLIEGYLKNLKEMQYAFSRFL